MGFPGVVGCRVSCPPDTVLQGPSFSVSTGSHDFFDFPFFFSFDDVQGWFRVVWSVFLRFFIWAKEGGVEHVVYAPLRRYVELVDHGGYDVSDLERPVVS